MTAQPFLFFEDFQVHAPLTKSQRLAAEILRDRETKTTSGQKVVDCRACGRRTLDQGDNHCSHRCREWTARGEPPYSEHSRFDPFAITRWRVVAGGDPGYLPRTSMRMGSVEWFITCPTCKRQFEAKGLRCCSTDCERQHSADLKHGGTAGGPVCLGCGGPIPTRAGKRVHADRRFHDDKCRKRHRRSQRPDLSAKGGKKSNEIKAKFWPLNLIGGRRVEGETEIEPGLRKTVIATEVFGNRRGKSE